jgi:hypothetical protein
VIVELWVVDHAERTSSFADVLDGSKATPDSDMLYVDALFRRKAVAWSG